MAGRLLVVATPIGNLADLTIRALKVLQDADVVAAEDTRATRKLLTHHGVRTTLVSYHRDNERLRTPELLERLRRGERVALVSEAGTPSISDPGHILIRAAIDADIPVESIPGPSALISALVISGLSTAAFVFDGFLPRKSGERRRRLETLRAETRTLVFFEAPHRLDACLADLLDVVGDRQIALCRELTKMHEEIVRGTIGEIVDRVRRQPVKGEIVLVVGGAEQVAGDVNVAAAIVLERVASGDTVRSATDAVAVERSVPRRALYDRVLEMRKESS